MENKTEESRFLQELYGLCEGHATRAVSGEELARRLGIDLDKDADKARFSSTARHLEEEGQVIANKTGRRKRPRLPEPLYDLRGHPGGGGKPAGLAHVRGKVSAGADVTVAFGLWLRPATAPHYSALPSPTSRTVCKPLPCKEGDRRGSIPRPSLVPQSADTCFQVLLYVAESA